MKSAKLQHHLLGEVIFERQNFLITNLLGIFNLRGRELGAAKNIRVDLKCGKQIVGRHSAGKCDMTVTG
jgi:hypothetical protein